MPANSQGDGIESQAMPSSPSVVSKGGEENNILAAFLLGTYTPKIDVKGRLALPAKFRTQLGDGFVLARGQEHCVYLLPITEFTRMASQIQRASIGDKKTRDYLRVFLSGALEGQVDKQGRVVVPPMLRSYAHLGSDIVVIGVGTRAEIWDSQAWNDYLDSQEEGYSMISDDVLPPMGSIDAMGM